MAHAEKTDSACGWTVGEIRMTISTGVTGASIGNISVKPLPALRNRGLRYAFSMSIVRFFMLLSLVIWIGGIIFFAFVLAPTVFSVLPSRHLAGSVVSQALLALHWIGIVSGVVFVATSMIYARYSSGSPSPLAARHLLVVAMIALTLVSQYAIGSKMLVLRTQMGVIDDVPVDDVRRVEFNRLHHWSTRLETTVLLFGLAALYLTARRLT